MYKRGMTRREREVTDLDEIKKILDKCKILHLGLVDGDEPYVVPMNYGYEFVDGQLILYLHGAAAGYKLDLIRANPKVFFEMDCDVTMFEGELPCQYGNTYASVMGRGKAELIEDTEGKSDGLKKFMKTQTGKDFEFPERVVKIVTVIKITASDFTAKRRLMPGAED